MSEAPRGEFDARGETELGMTRKFRICFAIVEEMFRGDVTFECREKVLCRDAVTWLDTLAVENFEG
jgi:hypothetical protein